MQTIFRADLRKLQSSDSCIPRHLLSHGLAAVRAPVAPKEAAGLGGPKPAHAPRPPGTRNRRPGLATTHGVRARHDQLIRAIGGLHFSIFNLPRGLWLGAPPPPWRGDGAGPAPAPFCRGASPCPPRTLSPTPPSLRA